MMRRVLLGSLGAALTFLASVVLFDVPWFESPHAVPKGFAGYVWTIRIELMGPELERQGR